MNRKQMDAATQSLFDGAAGTVDTKATKDTKNTKGRKTTQKKGLHIPTPDQNVSAPLEEPKSDRVTPVKGAPYYRLNLKLSPELDGYLRDEAWVRRMSRTELVNKILLAYAKENPHT